MKRRVLHSEKADKINRLKDADRPTARPGVDEGQSIYIYN